MAEGWNIQDVPIIIYDIVILLPDTSTANNNTSTTGSRGWDLQNVGMVEDGNYRFSNGI